MRKFEQVMATIWWFLLGVNGFNLVRLVTRQAWLMAVVSLAMIGLAVYQLRRYWYLPRNSYRIGVCDNRCGKQRTRKWGPYCSQGCYKEHYVRIILGS